jgi:hypothetical protein
MKWAAEWIQTEPIDSETIARVSYLLAPFLFEQRAHDRACVSGLALEAAEIFQQLHFSFDPLYWDTRDYPLTIEQFVGDIINALQREPEWLNGSYVMAREQLADLLRRHPPS